MSLRINTPEALKRFLEIVVEEATSNAYAKEKKLQQKFAEESLHEADPEDEKDPLFADDDEGGDEGGGDDEGGDDVLFADDDEGGDDEGGGEEELDLDAPEDDGAGLEKQKQQGDAYETKPTPLDLELGKISSEGISGTLNLIRAGRSFKDANVAEELRTYIESLSDAEALALGTFLSAIRDIAVGHSAEEAPDPSDPEYDVSVKPQQQKSEDQPEQDPQQQQQQQAQPEQRPVQQDPQQQEPRRPQPDELEDTEAPIQVGRRNENVERDQTFRNHIRELIRGGNK